MQVEDVNGTFMLNKEAAVNQTSTVDDSTLLLLRRLSIDILKQSL